MEYLDNIIKQSIDRYFTVLRKTGYINGVDTDKILLLSFLHKFLNEYQFYITELDYNTIDRIINCMSGLSCLVPFKRYMQNTPVMKYYITNIPIRGTEDSNIRYSELQDIRLINL